MTADSCAMLGEAEPYEIEMILAVEPMTAEPGALAL